MEMARCGCSIQEALKLAPGDAEAADQYGQFLLAAGRLDATLGEIDRAQRLDPLSGIIGVTRANTLTALSRFDDADAQAKHVITRYPDYALGHFVAADTAVYWHDYAKAESPLRRGEVDRGKSGRLRAADQGYR